MAFLPLPGVCDCPLCTGGEVDYPSFQHSVYLSFLLFLNNLFAVTPDSREEKGSSNLLCLKCEGGSNLFCL